MAVGHTRIAQMEKALEDAQAQLWEREADAVLAGTPEADAELLALSPQNLKDAALHWLTRDKRVGEGLLKKLLMVREQDLLTDDKVIEAESIRSSRLSHKISKAFNVQKARAYCPVVIVHREQRKIDEGSQFTMYGPTARRLVTEYKAEYYYLHAGKLHIGSTKFSDGNHFRKGDEGAIMVDQTNPERHSVETYVRKEA